MKKKKKDGKSDPTYLVTIVEALLVASRHKSFESSVHSIRINKAGYVTEYDNSIYSNEDELKQAADIARCYASAFEHLNGGDPDVCLSEDVFEVLLTIGSFYKFLDKCLSILKTSRSITGRTMDKLFKEMGYTW